MSVSILDGGPSIQNLSKGTRAMKQLWTALSLGVAMMTAACTAPSQGNLNAATAACSQGNRAACQQLPMLNAQVQQENSNNQLATGAAAALGGAVVGGAIAAPYGGYGPGYYRGGYYRNGYYYRGYGY